MTTIFWLSVFIAACGYGSFFIGVLQVLNNDMDYNRILASTDAWPIRPMRLFVAIAATIVAITI